MQQTRPRFILSSEGVFGGMQFEPMLTPRGKIPSTRKCPPEEDRTRDTVDSEPMHYQLSYSGPHLSFITLGCKKLTSEGEEGTRVPGEKPPMMSFRKYHTLKPENSNPNQNSNPCSSTGHRRLQVRQMC